MTLGQSQDLSLSFLICAMGIITRFENEMMSYVWKVAVDSECHLPGHWQATQVDCRLPLFSGAKGALIPMTSSAKVLPLEEERRAGTAWLQWADGEPGPRR